MKGASFVVDAFKDVVDVVLHCSQCIEPFYGSEGAEFVVIVEVHGVWIQAIEP